MRKTVAFNQIRLSLHGYNTSGQDIRFRDGSPDLWARKFLSSKAPTSETQNCSLVARSSLGCKQARISKSTYGCEV